MVDTPDYCAVMVGTVIATLLSRLGRQSDYLTYAGIYREVWFVMSARSSVGLHKIETPNSLDDLKTVIVGVTLNNPRNMNVAGMFASPNTLGNSPKASPSPLSQEP